MRAYLETLGEEPRLHRAMLVLIVESISGQAQLHEAVRANNELLRAAIAEQLARGLADGSVRADLDPAGEAVVVAGTARGVALQWLADPDRVDLPAATDRALAGLRRSYRAD